MKGEQTIKSVCMCVALASGCIAGAVWAERPEVSRAEAALLEQAADIAKTNAAAAVALLDDGRNRKQASAALDYSAGNLWTTLETYDQAMAAYETALQKEPAFDEARIGLGRVLVLAERWADAEEALRVLAQPMDAEEELLLLYGYVLLQLDRVITAESIYRRAVLAGGERPEARYGLARCFMIQERYTECAYVMQELVREAPDESDYWGLLADVWRAADQADKALTALETARRLEAMTPRMYAMLGDLYIQRGHARRAAKAYRAALPGLDANTSLQLSIAEGLVWADELETAEKVLAQYAQAETSPAPRYYKVQAQWAERVGDESAAMAAYADWVEREPTDLQALLGRGDLYYDAGDLGEASMWYERAHSAHARNAEPLTRLARVAIDRSAYEEAVDWLEQALVLSGDAGIERTLQQVRRVLSVAE